MVTKKVKTEKLTWEDMKEIVDIADGLLETTAKKTLLNMGPKGYYTEVLRIYEQRTNETL